jgi:DNA-binding MarR family transcriptional regulator
LWVDAAELASSQYSGHAHEPFLKKSTPRKIPKSPASPWQHLSRNGTGLNVEDFLTFRLTRLSNALRTNLTKRYLEEFNLSLPEWRLLALVTRFTPLRFSELTSRSSMDKGQVSRTLRELTKRGLIKMKIVKNRGSRSTEALAAPVVVAVTAAGKTLHKTVLPVARKRQVEFLMTLNEAERVALYATLDKLFVAIGSNSTTPDVAE